MKWGASFIALGIAACSSGGPSGTSGGPATGSGNSSTSSSTGGSSGTGGATVVGNCSHSVVSAALTPCSAATPCGCPMACVDDPVFGFAVCESPCTSVCAQTVGLPGMSCDALPVASICVDGYCSLQACAFTPTGVAAPGSYDGPCSVIASNDGTCFPTGEPMLDGGVALWGSCLQGNVTVDGGCTPNPSCAPGALWIGGGCQPLCDPTVTGSCATGTCQPFPLALNTHAGYCGPACSGNGQPCGEPCCDPLSACTTPGGATGTGGSPGRCNPGG